MTSTYLFVRMGAFVGVRIPSIGVQKALWKIEDTE